MVKQQFNLKAHAVALIEALLLIVPLFGVLILILAAFQVLGLPLWFGLIISVAVWGLAFWFVRTNRQNKERANAAKI